MRLLLSSLILAAAALPPLPAQVDKPAPGTTKEDEDVVKAGPVDPFADAAAMAAAGITAHAPFPWADKHNTADIDHVLGEQRILWLETTHFRFGFNLKAAPLPSEQGQKKALADEIRRLRQRLPKVPDKPKKLDPWLRLHLYAQRAEERYADFLQLVGATDASFGTGNEAPNGPYLGLPGKYLVLLFQKKSDLARYLDRFCNIREDHQSMRYYHALTGQMLFALAAEGIESYDEPAMHSQFVYSMMHNFMAGYRGYTFALPSWLSEGIAHWYSRQVETDFINCQPKAGESVNERDQHEWEKKIRLRAQHDGATLKFEQMVQWKSFDEIGYQGHIQSWSRIDYLLSRGADKVGQLLTRLKSLPVPLDGRGLSAETLTQAQLGALAELWNLDPAGFDTAWRDWVLKTYKK